jgi:hypothetical protein
MLSKSVPSRPAMRQSILTLLGPTPNLQAILIGARFSRTPDIERHRLQLLGYREKLVALLNLIEGSLTTSEDKAITSERTSSVLPPAA